jgi:DtxR family Mn-dependent transcriptional regulator
MNEKLSEALENYIKEIYQIQEIKGFVKVIDLIRTLDISPGTISKALEKLEKLGLIERKDRRIKLTDDGKKIAERLVKSHMLSERLLTDIIGIDWIRAHEIAHKLEHVWTDDILEKLDQILGKPSTCPHGHPIPGRAKITGKSLNEVEEGKDYKVLLIVKEAEWILRELDKIGIKPQSKIKLVKKDENYVYIETNGKISSISYDLAEQIIVN